MSGDSLFFADTNLILYCVDPVDQQRREKAQAWMDYLWWTGRGRVSWQVLHEFYSNAVRKMRLDRPVAREMVEDLYQWRPVDSSLAVLHIAWQLMDASAISYWDALIVAAAQRCGAGYLLSEDLQHGRRYGDLQIVNPFRQAPPARVQPTN